jgi:hypothetical protein
MGEHLYVAFERHVFRENGNIARGLGSTKSLPLGIFLIRVKKVNALRVKGEGEFLIPPGLFLTA